MAQEVSCDELETAIAENAFVLDVREDWEFEAGHAPTAHHIPLNSVPERLEELPKEQQIFIICKSGGRSMRAADYLLAQGFDVVSVAGGTDGWVEAGKEVSFEVSR
jgi:rhodanese-related sulfurtransferase